MSNVTIVRELDSRYAIALGFCAAGDDDVYDNEAEARNKNSGNPPRVVFVIVDKQDGSWADFAMEGFARFDDAMQRYIENKDADDEPEPLLMQLDDDVALFLYPEDMSSQVCPGGYTFGFYDIQNHHKMVNEPTFPTFEEALAYYNNGKEEVISDFNGKYAFLNNGFDQVNCPIFVFGKNFRTAEGAFQSQKHPARAVLFTDRGGRGAKTLGSSVPLRDDWDSVRDLIMYDVLHAKFTQNPELMQALKDTGSARIEPHNMNHENYWGSCQCAECANKKKENRLGSILMRIRENLGQ